MKKKKVVVVFTLFLLLMLIIFLKISLKPFDNYSNKERSACLLREKKIIGFDFTKIQNQGTTRSYIPVCIKLKKTSDDYKKLISMVIKHFETWSSSSVINWQVNNFASMRDYAIGYEGFIDGIWVEYKNQGTQLSDK